MVLQATRNWLRRNRYPVAIGTGLIGAGYLAGQYVLGKLTEARQRMSDERIAKENLRRRFKQNQEDCTYTVLGLLPTVTENIMQQLPVEDITSELQTRRSERLAKGDPSASSSEIAPSDTHEESSGGASASGSYIHASQVEGLGQGSARSEIGSRSHMTKMQLWEELKIASITRAISLIYTLSLLSLLTRIQLNLLGRRNYLSSVISLASPPDAGASQISLEDRDDNQDADYSQDFDTNRKYLTLSWWLLHRGWTQLVDEVGDAVKNAFGTLNPRDSVSFSHLSELILDVRKGVEGHTELDRRHKEWLKVLMPLQKDEQLVLRESGVVSQEDDESEDLAITPSLRRLIDETSDIIESPTFSHILTVTLDAAFSLLVDDKIATLAYKIPSQFQSSNRAQQPVDSDPLAMNPLLDRDSRIEELPDEATSLPAITSTTCKLATILAIFTRQAHAIGSGGDLNDLMASASANGLPDMANAGDSIPSIKDANQYLAVTEDIRDLEAFAAVIYSSNFELEGIETGMEAGQNSLETEERRDTPPERSPSGPAVVDPNLQKAWEKATAS